MKGASRHMHLISVKYLTEELRQLAEAKLRLEGINTGQEDVEVGTFEEYAAMLPFELPRRSNTQRRLCLRVEAQDPDNGAPI
ncbi:hypothetical protein GW17_00052042 [Ensete ventricosum]|nr:hypothetical protein GW17_00052042 [Ensete ventricosum]RZS25436.1 hypothetical protein BHM03_00058630 [Ensete ventricosum]